MSNKGVSYHDCRTIYTLDDIMRYDALISCENAITEVINEKEDSK